MTIIDLPPAGPDFARLDNKEYRELMQRNVAAYRKSHPEDSRSPISIAAMLDHEACRLLAERQDGTSGVVGSVAVEGTAASPALAEANVPVQAGAGTIAVSSEYRQAV